jgi:hypothetical protein
MSETTEKKTVKRTVVRKATPAAPRKSTASTSKKSSDSSKLEKWLKLFLQSRHGAREDRFAAREKLTELEKEILKSL